MTAFNWARDPDARMMARMFLSASQTGTRFIEAAVVTGASRGIGRACAEQMLLEGWGVVCVVRDASTVTDLLERHPGRAICVRGDVTNAATNRRAVATAVEQFGNLQAAVGNAGVSLRKSIDETTDADFSAVVDVNLRSLVYLAQAAHGPLVASEGSFVVVASNKGLVAQRDSPLYVATKGAAVQLARALALDWAAEKVRVNAICPGVVDTDMLAGFLGGLANPADARAREAEAQPLGRLASPAECARAITFLTSAAASYITGVALPVDGGFTAK